MRATKIIVISLKPVLVLYILIISALAESSVWSATATNLVRRPVIGAEIIDDPNATPEKIDAWFKMLADHQMPLARVFIPRDETGLRRMDGFFHAAEKYQVGITATLGGQPSAETERWIKEVVQRYKNSPALDSWILRNEPGQSPEPTKLAVLKYKGWLKDRYQSIDALDHAWGKSFTDFEEIEFNPEWLKGSWSRPAPFIDWYTFWRSHLTWQLRWIAELVCQADPAHPTHVNPHGLVNNLAANSLDLPAWRGFLSSLGASAHPSWHFSILNRDEYALGLAYICDLIQGAAEPKPFWITELQGGNNLNSGNRPLCPMKEDIAQWLWTCIGSGADRVIFWLLNNRSVGNEAGEWSLLDLQNQPSERLATAGQIASILNQRAAFFQAAEPVETPITILLSLETMTLQERFSKTQPVNTSEQGKTVRLEGRDHNAHLCAALAYYRILHELGIPTRLKFIHDFDWRTPTAVRQMAILPNLAALSDSQAKDIETFVRNGNTALLTGLTGVWDPDDRFWTLTAKFPLEDLLGATLKEFRTLDESCQVTLATPKVTLPSHLWVGEILNRNAVPIGRQSGWITAIRKDIGRGQVFWIPSLVDVAAWVGDNKPLGRLVTELTVPFARDLPFWYVGQQPGCLLRILRNGKSYVTVVANGTRERKRFRLRHPDSLAPRLLWSDGSIMTADGTVSLEPRGTVVTLWQ